MAGCDHLDTAPLTPALAETARVCPDCVAIGGRWVHLRRCLSCDHIGCCDSSPNRHATAHFQGTHHPVVASFEPGETWRWCYVDEVGVDEARA
ncbi:MAG: UBP-type zinc finger domain-containing protein [Actinomycetes bacterium]